MTPRPIEIIGGGLAGLALGCALRRAGVPATLHEAGDYPRHRVCGEFVTGLGDDTVARLGLAPAFAGALTHRRVAWTYRDGAPRLQTLPSPALALSRFALDARLAATFSELGGELRTRSRVAATDARAGRVFATGRRRATASPWIGLKVHARGLAPAHDLEMHLGDHCYAGLSRVEGGAVNVCGLFRRGLATGSGPTLLLQSLRAAGLEALARRLARAEIDAGSFCAVAALGFAHTAEAEDRFCVGDAIGMLPPFTGNGMAAALQGAELALEPLLAYARGLVTWPDAVRAGRTAQRRKFRRRFASAAILHPFLLHPWGQRCFAALGRARLLPFRPLYAALH